jgi:pyruvate,water dikinase
MEENIMPNILWFKALTNTDVAKVGGKNASLGEMISRLSNQGIRVPNGFATTADAFRKFLQQRNLQKKIDEVLKDLNPADVKKLKVIGEKIRKWIIDTPFLKEFETDLIEAYSKLNCTVAVRSSATAEDLPQASFAGQQETYLNISGKTKLLQAVKLVFASLYTNRAIVYRINNNFAHHKVALSAGIQKMVRSDKAGSGVAFSIDTETGFKDVVLINAAFGLGETVVQGMVNPDEYLVYKPNLRTQYHAILQKKCGTKAVKMVISSGVTQTQKTAKKEQQKFVLTDKEITELANYILLIEKHYKCPMDIEWAKDGKDNKLYIVQARPETVKSQAKKNILKTYNLQEKGNVITSGSSIGQKIGQGTARILKNASEISKFKKGEVLVTDMTDPDWEPVMKSSSAIVTNRGGRTCHAAIVARELDIPAVVGCNNATEAIKNKQKITVSCAEGDIGYIYDGLLRFKVNEQDIGKIPKIPVKIMLNIANPDDAFNLSFMPNDGAGLVRLEFIINNYIGMHPNALLNYGSLPLKLKNKIKERILDYKDPVSFYVDKLAEGIAMIAAAFNPKPVIVRTSDFKSNEYANLLGGETYEPHEDNPMIGFRGASRYVHEKFKKCFILECRALKQVRDKMGLKNVQIMIPFVRTIEELQKILKILEENGLTRGKDELKIIMMCEIPSNIILAEEFLEYVDGYSIGSNDLTQLTLGLDRDSAILAELFDERNEAVKKSLQKVIKICNRKKKYIGICGQAPSDYPDFALWLIDQKIGSISLNADTVLATWLHIAKHKKS